MSVEQGFGRDEVMRAAGISYRQLDYWARTKLLVPSVLDARGSGSKREYSFADIVKARTVKKLLDAGVSLPKIRKAIDFVRNEMGRPLEEVTIVSNGRNVYARTSPNEIVDLLRGGQAVFAIAVDAVYQEMQGTVAEFKRRTAELERAEAPEASEAHGG
jgi:DNA-binding transcriptional MerR regulator